MIPLALAYFLTLLAGIVAYVLEGKRGERAERTVFGREEK